MLANTDMDYDSNTNCMITFKHNMPKTGHESFQKISEVIHRRQHEHNSGQNHHQPVAESLSMKSILAKLSRDSGRTGQPMMLSLWLRSS